MFIHFDLFEGVKVKDVSFSNVLEPHSSHSEGSHEAIAQQWKKSSAEIASVIISIERLRDDLWDNPDFMHQEQVIICSEVEEEARRLINNNYYSFEELEALFEEKKWPTERFNYRVEDKYPRFKTELEDALFRSQELALIPEVTERLLEEAKYEYDEESGEERKLTGKKLKKALEFKKQEIFLPRVNTNYERVYAMPKPFSWWDSRNPFQQFYFVKVDGKVLWSTGGPSSSGQRETHGQLAHACAYFESLGGTVPTWVGRYTSDNQFVIDKTHAHFRAVHMDLTGNYRVSWEDTKHLFKGKTVKLDEIRKTNSNSIGQFPDTKD